MLVQPQSAGLLVPPVERLLAEPDPMASRPLSTGALCCCGLAWHRLCPHLAGAAGLVKNSQIARWLAFPLAVEGDGVMTDLARWNWPPPYRPRRWPARSRSRAPISLSRTNRRTWAGPKAGEGPNCRIMSMFASTSDQSAS